MASTSEGTDERTTMLRCPMTDRRFVLDHPEGTARDDERARLRAQESSGPEMPAPLDAVALLVDSWCNRRALRALSALLPGYVGFTGETESWIGLYRALRTARGTSGPELPPTELDLLNRALRETTAILRRAGTDVDSLL